MNKAAYTLDDFAGRGTIKVAPDSFIRINGQFGMTVLFPQENRGVFTQGVRSVSVTNLVDPPGASTATVEVVAPIYEGLHVYYWQNPSKGAFTDKATAKDIYPTREPIFIPMMEIEIFLKGRFLVRGEPSYYKSFWGYINTVEENFAGGSYSITLNCVDLLHWWSFIKVNMHPNALSNFMAGGAQTMTAYATIFKEAGPFAIMAYLTKSLGMDSFVTPTIDNSLTPFQSIAGDLNYVKLNALGIVSYWQERFKKLGQSLRMYGALGDSVKIADSDFLAAAKLTTEEQKAKLDAQLRDYQSQLDSESRTLTNPESKAHPFDISVDFLKNFTIFFDVAKMGDFTQSEYMSKLEIATVLKNRIGYEFFQDVTGDLIFKPPFYNMDVKHLFPYVIEAYDIISASFAVDPDSIITSMEINSSLHPQVREITQQRIGWHFDIELAKKYGMRHDKRTIDFIWRDDICRIFAAAEMSKENAKAYTGSVVIPGRPELRLGYPIYIPYKDSYHYVTSITHSFEFGGSFTTTLSLIGERKRVYEPDPLPLNSASSGGPLTLQKNKVYAFRGVAPESGQIYSAEAQKWLESNPKGNTMPPVGYYYRTNQTKPSQNGITESTLPFTDKEGYRVIGGFPYGRDIVLTSMRSDVLSEAEPKKENVSLAAKIVTGASVESEKMTPLIEAQEKRSGSDSTQLLGSVTAISSSIPVEMLALRPNAADPVRAITNMHTAITK